MSITSPTFAVFVLVALAIYHAAPRPRRWVVLLAASLVFYVDAGLSSDGALPASWGLLPVAGIGAVVVAIYGLALVSARVTGTAIRQALLACGLALVVGLFVVVRSWAGRDAALLLLPLGPSFLALRLVGYLVDVHRKTSAPERNLGVFALFAFIFPELPAGPIERAGRLIPQLRDPEPFRYDVFTSGVRLCAWGLFKKLVIADRLRPFVDSAYDGAPGTTGAGFLFATILFAFQLYCDFSGYSDIAIGLGRLFGLRFARNFDRPYAARSIPEFWSRWHISLSTWLRDYVFLPTVYSAGRILERWKVGAVGAYSAAAVLTMGLCGLWHGARWTYLVWGLSMAVMMIASVATRGARRRVVRRLHRRWMIQIRDAARVAMTFALVSFTWVFFRAQSVADALAMLRAMPSGVAGFAAHAARTLGGRAEGDVSVLFPLLVGQTTFELLIVIAAVTLLLVVETPWQGRALPARLAASPRWVRWPAYLALALLIVIFRAPVGERFIYQGF